MRRVRLPFDAQTLPGVRRLRCPARLTGHDEKGQCGVGSSSAEITVGGHRVRVRTAPASPGALVFFPSMGEYPVYDDTAYNGFTAGDARNRWYGRAVRDAAPGRVVLDIGTGRDALWAVAAAEAGARHAYAVESDPAAAAQARQAVSRAGLTDRITVIEGTRPRSTCRYPCRTWRRCSPASGTRSTCGCASPARCRRH
jgi:hypothetical protein